ncbi:MAG TPA: TIGR03668 family PPOX class F420-dependent oxidoreductase [Actinomycetota bacterium]|nr:TIGR03668 family PPOX class F420-dependent oxidoreductase [Actinomycetota bacterium]
MDLLEAERRFREARVARLATVRPGGAPHVVPVVFVLEGQTVWLVVDEKPKRTRELQRLVNIRFEPRVSLLVDGYDEDWRRLWWVRVDGRARIVEDGPELERCVVLIAGRYAQERERRPIGPAIVVQVERWRYWPDS